MSTMRKSHARWLALDFVKAIGAILMVVLHVVVWWHIPLDYGTEGTTKVSDAFFIVLPFLKFIGLFVIIIPITAGASLRFYLKEVLNKKFSILKNKKLISIFKRSILLIFLGYLINILAWGKDEFLDWDVLQFIGIGFILLVFMAKLGVDFLWVIGAFSLFSAPFLRAVLDDWKFNYFIAVLISNDEGNFFWPLFPWFSFLVYGYLVADYYIKNKKRGIFYFATAAVSAIAILIALYQNKLFFMPRVENFWGPEIFQAPTLTILGGISVFNIALIGAEIFLKNVKRLMFGFINTFSKGLLWIYILHIIIGYHLINFVNSVSGGIDAMVIAVMLLILLSYLIGVAVVWLKDRHKN